MATVVSTGSNLFLELDGKEAGALRSAQPASVRVDMVAREVGRELVVRRGVQVALGEMAAEAALPEPGPLLDWLQAVLAGKLDLHDGALLVGDANRKLQRRIGFRGARLSGLALTPLDARDGKQPVLLTLRWLAGQVDDQAGGGATLKSTASRRKAPLASNFRISGLPFDGSGVLRVELPALQVDWATSRVGELREPLREGRRRFGAAAVTVGARQAEAARAWVHKQVADGLVDEADGLALQVELLDPTLKKVLATITLGGCLLLGLDEDPIGTSSERSAGLVLRFDVGSMALAVG
ncbi:MAG TPA: hypothetical protein PKL46_03565 [Aquabacterium sp.]|nr:hypothetical protein [Aquabacterium sp.]